MNGELIVFVFALVHDNFRVVESIQLRLLCIYVTCHGWIMTQPPWPHFQFGFRKLHVRSSMLAKDKRSVNCQQCKVKLA